MSQKNPAGNPSQEREDRPDDPYARVRDLWGLPSPQRLSEGAPRYVVDLPHCGACNGAIALEVDGEPPYWRHLDLADLEFPHAAYRDELVDELRLVAGASPAPAPATQPAPTDWTSWSRASSYATPEERDAARTALINRTLHEE